MPHGSHLSPARAALLLLLALATWTSCSSPIADEHVRTARTAPLPAAHDAAPADYPGIHNVVAFGDGLYSGSQPEEGGLESLAALGIRTVISVDGAQPDVDGAAALGIRYVHLPIGYDGIDEDRKLELARAVRDLPGPVYVHCHHGKHRSAGAASAIGLMLGRFSNEYADARMHVSGTAPHYKGLWACAADTRPVTDARLDTASNAFPSRWTTSGMVQGMVAIDEAFEHARAIEKAGWKAPADHPDLVPAAEVARLTHVLRLLRDDAESKRYGAEFMDLLAQSEAACDQLEQGIVEGAQAAELSARFARVGQSCKACHADFRD